VISGYGWGATPTTMTIEACMNARQPHRGNSACSQNAVTSVTALHGSQAVGCAMRELTESASAEVTHSYCFGCPQMYSAVKLRRVGGQVLELDCTFETLDIVAHD
jgi:hypothetical protein